ncbi:MAG: hypothetical protein RQ751_14375, partial [Longimicrobiales bacterium]|nr:hypothetical protein [Longimicrobiales bacterium]
MRAEPARRGVALGAVVLVTLALVVMAHAALLLARTESWIVRAEGRRVESGYRAGAALQGATEALDSLPATGWIPGPEGAVEARRLSPETALLRAPLPGLPSREGRARLL